MPSGTLFTLDRRGFTVFYNQLVEMHELTQAMGMHLAKWENKQNTGLFSKMAASGAKLLIKNAIDGKLGNIIGKYPPPHEDYSASWDALGAYGKPWKFMGGVYSNVIIRKRGGGYEIGIDRRATVPITGFANLSKSPKSAGSRIHVETYASFVEFGTQWQEPRPLFSKVSMHYISTYIPALEKAATKSIENAAKGFSTAKLRSKTATADFSETMSSFSVAAATGGGEFKDQVAKALAIGVATKDDSSGINPTQYLGKAGVDFIDKYEKEDVQTCSSLGKQLAGMSEEQLKALRAVAPEYFDWNEE